MEIAPSADRTKRVLSGFPDAVAGFPRLLASSVAVTVTNLACAPLRE
jgi:hypothetical protein